MLTVNIYVDEAGKIEMDFSEEIPLFAAIGVLEAAKTILLNPIIDEVVDGFDEDFDDEDLM